MRLGRLRPSRHQLPWGVADPYFVGELCVLLGKTVLEIGRDASNYELCVFWPTWLAERDRVERIKAAKAEQDAAVKKTRFGSG